jgi:hypothetical protein
MGANGCLSSAKTLWLMDHSFEAGVEATGVTNGGETAGKSERMGPTGSALFFCKYPHN